MNQPASRTSVVRKSDREVVVTRVVNGPAHLVYQAWTQADLFRLWWVPKSAPLTLLSCEMDVRVGGGYRLVFQVQGNEMAFFGTYREVVPNAKLVWTNDEAGDEGQLSTATFEEIAGQTRVVLSEVYPTKAALDAALASGSMDGMQETFDQLQAFLTAG
jgi:uncharacterized protein YndB with AHSA1/START domain